jgi:ATP-binding cassette subfamily B protein
MCLVGSILEAATILQIGPVIESVMALPSSKTASLANSEYGTYFLFLILVFAVTITRISILYFQAKLAFNFGAEVQQSIVAKVLKAPWMFQYISTSDLISLAAVKSERLIRESVLQFLMIINSISVITAVVLGLLLTNPFVTAVAVTSIASIYIFLIFVFKIWINKASMKISSLQDLNIQLLEDVFKSKLEINLYSKFKDFSANLTHVVHDYRRTQSLVHLLGLSPRFLIEGIGLSALILFFLLSSEATNILGFIGVLALSAQRLMPLIQVIYAGRTAIAGNKYAMNQFIEILESEQYGNTLNSCNDIQSISFENFSIVNCDYVSMEPVSFGAKAGELIVIKGDSGVGKSTFLSVLLGWDELEVSGELKINNEVIDLRSYLVRNKVAYVPQKICVLRQSLKENITLTLNKDEVDEHALNLAIESVGLANFLHLENFKESRLSQEMLSGGQLQRIAIARALYVRRSLILLDEATDGLDEASERIILTNIKINYPNAVIFLISHKTSAANLADRVLEFTRKK